MRIRSLMPIVLLALVGSAAVPAARGLKIENRGSKIEDRGSKIAATVDSTGNAPSSILDPLSSILHPQSSILDPLSSNITGDYVEARTASVFCGPCHYNGELVTSGRDAILAWNITHGSWKGVDLTGVRAMASITSGDVNLSDPDAVHRYELTIDPSASEAQAAAVGDWLTSCDGTQLGKLTATHRAAITFRHDGGEYIINGEQVGSMQVQPMPNSECCTQPHLVWYSPLMPLEHRKVGYTISANSDTGPGDRWERGDENSAFYGSFSVAGQ